MSNQRKGGGGICSYCKKQTGNVSLHQAWECTENPGGWSYKQSSATSTPTLKSKPHCPICYGKETYTFQGATYNCVCSLHVPHPNPVKIEKPEEQTLDEVFEEMFSEPTVTTAIIPTVEDEFTEFSDPSPLADIVLKPSIDDELAEFFKRTLPKKEINGMVFYCDVCDEQLTTPGALLFSPPNRKEMTKKFHICPKCYYNIVDWAKLQPDQP